MKKPTEDNENQENLLERQKKASSRKKKKHRFGYLYLFAFVFILASVSLSYVVKYYSPDVDVTIGNKEEISINDSDFDYEARPIDERLKWIQIEDEMPTVSVKKYQTEDFKEEDPLIKRENKKDIKKEKQQATTTKKEERVRIPEKVSSQVQLKIQEPQKLQINENLLVKKKESEKTAPSTVSKVYVGSFQSLDEAISMQHKLTQMGLGIAPFVKSQNGHYVVQAGSFNDNQKADALVSALKAKGINARKN